MEYVWSAYEVMGEIIMKIGATKPVTKDTMPILKGVPGIARELQKEDNWCLYRGHLS